MRNLILAVLVLAVAVVPVAVYASGEGPPPDPDSPAERHTVTVTDLDDATRSTAWQPLSDVSNDIRSRGLVTVTVSAQLSGAPVELRVRSRSCGEAGRRATLTPGRVTFRPPGGHRSTMAFTFVGGSTGAVCRSYRVQWRSVTGARAVYQTGTMHITYDRPA